MNNNNNNNNNEKSEWAKRDVGALWKRESATQKYLSGYVKVDELGIERELKIVVFSNKNKNNNEKAPDYRIYVSKPLEKSLTNSEKNQNVSVKTQKTKIKEGSFSEKNNTSKLEAEEELL
jgi:uncharacterized protein (DUF736 family)